MTLEIHFWLNHIVEIFYWSLKNVQHHIRSYKSFKNNYVIFNNIDNDYEYEVEDSGLRSF